MLSTWGTVEELAKSDPEILVRNLAAHAGIAYSSSSRGELGAWRKSIPALLRLLIDLDLRHVHVLLEYRLPYSPRRVDALLCGAHPETGLPSYVLVELKQWSRAKMVAPGLVSAVAGRVRFDLHPAEQVRRYCRYLLDFTPSLARRPGLVKGAAYMHNLYRTPEWNLDDFDYDDFGRLYTADQLGDFATDLTVLLDTRPESADEAKKAARALIEASRVPARTLLKTAAEALAGRESFVLLDEQKVAYDLVLRAVAAADRREPTGQWQKTVILVRGGPGSGKSAIAISLLAALTGQRKTALHATGSKAFTETLRRYVANSSDRAEDVFKYFNNFDDIATDSLDVLVCDEAHRVRDNDHVPAKWRARYPPQVAKLIDVAKVPVFLLDENQAVRPGEAQTVHRIAEVALEKGCRVEEVQLDGQFRCGGSPYYDEWVLRLLGFIDGGPIRWTDIADGADDEYVVDSVDTPDALEAWLKRQEKSFGGTARIAAGFCWNWRPPVREGGKYVLVEDVVIGGWRRPWNVKQGYEVEGVPSASYWASDPAGFGQVGCIYTAQGFEYDWAGVIFGPDLVIRDGRWRADPERSRDEPVKKTDLETFGKLIRNTYKVLMTRGMQGVCLYSTDPETNAFLKRHSR
ncbi:DNA/RNA helicase domain-containing protein [Amycolatopsis pigmentata]|uniref:DNA/RNA helicase domain-containing protein n=1 Tax=Amycolatopsis pigmentata TaxID=450801 RepID=A0ABW5FJB1_9PSEU